MSVMDSTTVETTVTVVAGLLLIVGVLGTIIPILPGSLLVIGTLLVWAWVLGSAVSWTTGIIGIVLTVIGLSSSAILTGRKMRREQIPNGPVIFGVVIGVIGMFLVPVVGLFLGFALGLLVAEYVRRRDLAAAWRSSVEALKSLGLGMLLEFAFASLAVFAFAVGTFLHFSG